MARMVSSMGRGSFRFPAGVSTSNSLWAQLKIGGGGFVTGLDIAPDGAIVIRTDTFGAYKWSGTGWTSLFTSSSLATGEYGHDANGDWINAEGVYEIRIAPPDSSRMYAMLSGKMYVTSNGGATWTKCSSWTRVLNCDPNEQGHPGRCCGARMAVDPNNKDVCIVGTASDGVWRTANGGTSWTQISSGTIPFATTVAGGILVCWDDVVANKVYVSSYGNGVYISTDNGVNWSASSGSPTTHIKMKCRNGIIWHIDASGFGNGSGVLRKYTGSWSSTITVDAGQNDRCFSFDVDPSNSSRIIVMEYGGCHSISTNGGTTFTGWAASAGPSGLTRSAGAGEPAWLAWTNEDSMSNGDIRFHPTNSNELWFAEGIGVWTSNPPNTATANAWSAKSQGIEQLVSNGVISPPNGVPLVYGWDRPIFRIANPKVYPSTHGPNRTSAIVHAGSADWASSDPTCIFLLANRGDSDQTSKSNDGGQTWSLVTLPSSELGAGVAAASNQNFVWIGANSIDIWRTKNGGTSWAKGTITGPNAAEAYFKNQNLDRQVLCADRVNAGTFYVYYNGTANSDGAGTNADGSIAGIYKTADGGDTWTKVNTSPSGRPLGNNNTGYTLSDVLAKLRSVPNLGSQSAAGHLFFTGGDKGGSVAGSLMRSFDGGVTWTAVANVLEALDVGFGAPGPGSDYPSVVIAGWVGGTAESNYGIWQCTSNFAAWQANTQTWTKLGDYPAGNFDFVKCISGDSNDYRKVYVGFLGSGWAYYGP